MILKSKYQQVTSQTSIVEMVPEYLQAEKASPDKVLNSPQWDVFVEKAGIWGEADFVTSGFVDHINTTKDTTDYLWYTTRLVSQSLRTLGVS